MKIWKEEETIKNNWKLKKFVKYASEDKEDKEKNFFLNLIFILFGFFFSFDFFFIFKVNYFLKNIIISS